MTLFGRYFWTSNYVNEQPKKFPTCHVRNISIYAPTRGATPIRDDLRQVQAISIHAPTRGATQASGAICYESLYFNPRSYKRSDYAHGLQMPLILYFNPRSYKRSDCARKSDQVLSVISIHAPTRGATDSCRLCVWIDIISIHAPTRGATIASHKVAMLFMYFNPRSYKRSDWRFEDDRERGNYFNPRSYKRSDLFCCCNRFLTFLFQSTLLQEERQCEV